METAVLLSCHGTVATTADLPAFLANIRRGHPAPEEVVREVTRRYEAIGGSPLTRITTEQAQALEARLGVPVAWSARLWHPFTRDVVASLYSKGVRRLISLPLAPQSVHVYHADVAEAAKSFPEIEIVSAPSYGLEPAMLEACLEVVSEALARFDEASRGAVAVVLSAHSLPKRIIEGGDPYERDFRAMAEAVSARLGRREHATRIAFQSQGMTRDPWIGPDLPTTFTELASAGARNVVIAPIGFVADHVETLYDLDVEAPALAHGLGIERLERAPAFNARPRFIDALEAVARRVI